MSVASLRRAAAALVLVGTLGVGSLVAQSPSPSPSASAWTGTFKGPWVSDGPSGTMTLTFSQEKEVWKVVNQVEGQEVPPPGGDPRDLKVEGNAFQFAQTFGEFDVLFKGTLEGDLIKGTLEAYQAGSMVATGSFELKKQP